LLLLLWLLLLLQYSPNPEPSTLKLAPPAYLHTPLMPLATAQTAAATVSAAAI
jgi:hypothetical protein